MNALSAAMLILAVAAASGCVMPWEIGGSGSGVSIISFEPGFPSAYSGEPIDFRLKVQNTGSVDAVEVKPRITGLGTWRDSGGTCEEWERLSAPIPEIGAPGETASCYWTYEAPELPQGLSAAYSPMVRLYYGYRTSAVESVFLASSNELRSMIDRGIPVPGQKTSQTSGPIKIDIKPDAPIRFWEGSVTFPIAITITNVGGGVVCPSVGDCESGSSLNKLRLEIDSGSSISVSDCDLDEVTLWQGRSNTMVCKATFSGLGSTGSGQKQIRIDANYGYYIDGETSVKVNKR
jgi:hypothetical protein